MRINNLCLHASGPPTIPPQDNIGQYGLSGLKTLITDSMKLIIWPSVLSLRVTYWWWRKTYLNHTYSHAMSLTWGSERSLWRPFSEAAKRWSEGNERGRQRGIPFSARLRQGYCISSYLGFRDANRIDSRCPITSTESYFNFIVSI